MQILDYKTKAIVLLVESVIALVFQVWFFYIVYKCYVFFRAQCAFYHNRPTTVAYSAPVVSGYNTVQVTTTPTAYNYNYQQPQVIYVQQPPAYAPQELELGVQK